MCATLRAVTRFVSSALVEMGVDRGRIDSRRYGEACSVSLNETAIGRQLNRRVEIVLSEDDGKISLR